MSTNIKGIDVSNNNGHIDFKKVKATGKVAIVYMKASEGNYYRDKYLDQNYINAKDNGLKVGFYHFFKADKDAKEQAIYFVTAIKGKTPDCMHMCDVELDCGKSAAYISNAVKIFIDEVIRLTGQETGIYTYTGFAQPYLNSTVTKYKLWIANYCGENKIPGCRPWSNYIGHQYSAEGSVSGINGHVDMNNFTDNIYLGFKNTNTSADTTSTFTIYSVRKLQEVLKKLCHYKGQVDGIAGTQTIAAIKEFEKVNGLKVTGKVEGKTLEMLKKFGL